MRDLLAAPSNAGPSRPPRQRPEDVDVDYDQVVRTLAFDARAKPKDRTKTEEELAVEERDKLDQAEVKRLRRMRGGMSDEEDGGSKKRNRQAAGGDDLEDDFVEEDLLGPGLTREDIENMALPGAADIEGGSEGDENESDGDDDEDEEEDENEDEDSGEGDEEDDIESEDNLEDLDEDDLSEDQSVEEVTAKSKGGKRHNKSNGVKEIPFTFPCPASIDELEDVLDDHDDTAVPIIIQRIRALHHPSLAQGNKEKLQVGLQREWC